MQYKISVIIPVYNAEETIIRCLKSVTEQTIAPKEIICIDDGSTDNSLVLLRRYSLSHHEVKVINHDNMGTGATRNVGIDIALGEYIAFIDADDEYVQKDALELLYNAAEKNNVYIAGGRTESNWNGITKIEHYCDDAWLNHVVITANFPYFWGFFAYIYRKKIFDDGGNRFPIRTVMEDQTFLQKVLYSARKLYTTSSLIIRYYNGSHIHAYFSQANMRDIVDSYNEMISFAYEKKNKVQIQVLLDQLLHEYSFLYLSSLFRLPENIKRENELLNVVNKAAQYIDYDEGLLKAISIQDVIDNYTRDSLCFNAMISQIKSAKSVVIYGARNAAVVLSEYLSNELNISIDSFAVSDTSANVTQIDNIPVRDIDKYTIHEYNNTLFVIATVHGYTEIVDKLKSLSVSHYLYFDWSHMSCLLQRKTMVTSKQVTCNDR